MNYFSIGLKPKDFKGITLIVWLIFNNITNNNYDLRNICQNFIIIYTEIENSTNYKTICSNEWVGESTEATKCKYICECQNDLCNDVYIVLFGSGNGQPVEFCEINLT